MLSLFTAKGEFQEEGFQEGGFQEESPIGQMLITFTNVPWPK